MFYYILGGALLITSLIPLLLLLFGHADKQVCTVAATATILCGGLLVGLGAGLRTEAKETYGELLSEKAFIEANYKSEDLFTQWEVHDAYWRYMFKYTNVVESGNTSIISQYYGYDIEALELDIE